MKKVKTIAEVYEGFKNLAWKKSESEILARERLEICIGCDHLQRYRGFYLGCDMCGCYIPAKIRSIKSSCPIGEWKGFTKEEYKKKHDKSNTDNRS